MTYNEKSLLAFELRTDGLTFGKIAKNFKEQGITGRGNKTFKTSQIPNLVNKGKALLRQSTAGVMAINPTTPTVTKLTDTEFAVINDATVPVEFLSTVLETPFWSADKKIAVITSATII